MGVFLNVCVVVRSGRLLVGETSHGCSHEVRSRPMRVGVGCFEWLEIGWVPHRRRGSFPVVCGRTACLGDSPACVPNEVFPPCVPNVVRRVLPWVFSS